MRKASIILALLVAVLGLVTDASLVTYLALAYVLACAVDDILDAIEATRKD